MPLGRGTDLIHVDSDHFNSDEDFVKAGTIVVRRGRFRLVAATFTFNVKTCTFQLIEWPKVRTVSNRRRRYRRVVLTIPEQVKLQQDLADCGEDKVPRPFVRNFQAIFRWKRASPRFSDDFKQPGKARQRE